MHVVCFDVDGTLVSSAGFDGELYAEVIRDVLGVELKADLSQYQNVSDSGILAEIIERFPDANERTRLARDVQGKFVECTKRYVADHPHLIREVPGAVALVEALRRSPKVAVCIATGGWAETAVLKLRAIGLDPSGLPMATSSDAVRRTEIMRLAESRATQGVITRRTYFGDGAWDKIAAAELGYGFVAVGHGVDHHVSYPDLRDLETILGQLGV
ncbi:HAD family hydrolase [Wenzhouxiangella limi]|uniref:HAD family hydrolase n=1 Tax=Wenzhouxiangella limi TaxID=2707351 RepID=A0A845UUW1_9GAMM|nr:HAD family hydrolase [Wenzhouxiangella limi]NDY94348.1 HAD family hydrolase [Wenzhouxiangella limi]